MKNVQDDRKVFRISTGDDPKLTEEVLDKIIDSFNESIQNGKPWTKREMFDTTSLVAMLESHDGSISDEAKKDIMSLIKSSIVLDQLEKNLTEKKTLSDQNKKILKNLDLIYEKNACARVRLLDWLSEKLHSLADRCKNMANKIQQPCAIKLPQDSDNGLHVTNVSNFRKK